MSDTATDPDPTDTDAGTDDARPDAAGPDAARHARPPSGHGATAAWRGPATWVAVTVMLLMVTKGPVFRIRFEAAPLGGDFIDDRWVQGAFVLGALVVVGLCVPAARRLRSDPALVVAIAVLVGLVVASAAWSVAPGRTADQGVMMAFGTAAALLAGASLSRLGLVTALAVAAHVGVGASVFARWRDWPLALDRNGDLAGIYFNRNSLGPVALAAAVTAAVLGLVAIRRASSWRGRWPAVPLGALVVVDAWVWWSSGSLTPVFGVVVAGTAVGVFALTLPGPHALVRRRVAVVVGGSVAVLALAAVVLRATIATRLDRSPTLSGRTEIWDVVMQFVGERPLHGWGFLAAWTRPDIVDALADQYGREVFEAHSGFLEVLLGVGLVGLAALVAVVGLVLWRVGTATWRLPDALGLLLFGVAVYAVAVNLGETFVGANLLPWTLLMAVAGRAVHELDGTRA